VTVSTATIYRHYNEEAETSVELIDDRNNPDSDLVSELRIESPEYKFHVFRENEIIDLYEALGDILFKSGWIRHKPNKRLYKVEYHICDAGPVVTFELENYPEPPTHQVLKEFASIKNSQGQITFDLANVKTMSEEWFKSMVDLGKVIGVDHRHISNKLKSLGWKP
jgi:hypothetical protein